jgi:hypothetical protein
MSRFGGKRSGNGVEMRREFLPLFLVESVEDRSI